MGEAPFQELADAGGLEAVLRAACPGCDIEMSDAPGAFGGFTAKVSKGDRAVHVIPVAYRRLFRVRHQVRGQDLSRLSTTRLAEVTGATAVWLSGATARELAAAWPFADFVAVADAYESGDPIELKWQLYRAHDQDGLGGFVEAAMREPRLRRMYPVKSVDTMSFQPTTAWSRSPGPWVRPAGGGRFEIVEPRGEDPAVTYDAAEAVRVCVAALDCDKR
ncbi:DUF6193 family natural product biosynthesis protein [Amycolatopsis sp. NBC_01307]|uniref:DUF6193 family natural product biosynthesis protein n=1 Tax=Amycolatopsis sp. NBC_01307 TaxID=2903561 RepID=UPI002E0D3415|nr:DUF6193 family natural product biosynthesis protein [Amycolatopsis sp. NBC_01307]